MPATEIEIRRGAYYDSVVLMQLQAALVKLPDVLDAGVIMGTPANKELLEQSGLRVPGVEEAVPDDLIIVVKCDLAETARDALSQVDTLLASRRSVVADQEYLPQSLESATEMLPDAQWVLISVPGRYAAGVARESLRLGKNVFLYSDNVSLEDEIALKQEAAHKGLLVMGPDCGTAIVNGIGLGFANRVRRGPIGVVGASGTGLQQVTARIHQLGSGVTHALGTGGRDLSESVGATTMMRGLDLLTNDPDTKVIVLISKPPSPEVARQLLERAQASGKPVVVDFIGYTPNQMRDGNIHFARSLDQTAEMAVGIATSDIADEPTRESSPEFAEGQKYLRGLFSGGTLAYEALLILQDTVPGIYSNVPLDKKYKLENSLHSHEHSIIDLGEDEFTVGRLHPMLDHTLRIQRLVQEASDPETAVILLDVVLGYGAHPHPAGELAPVIQKARESASQAGRHLEVIAVVVGTDEDPQGLEGQIDILEAAGALVVTSNEQASQMAGNVIQSLNIDKNPSPPARASGSEVNLNVINAPLAAINVGLESFTESLQEQGAGVIHVNWRPPAGGNEKLMGILERMKAKG